MTPELPLFKDFCISSSPSIQRARASRLYSLLDWVIAKGIEAAIETADMALKSDDLSKRPWLIRHSRRWFLVPGQKIAFSFSINTIFVIRAFIGFASLWPAIGADIAASMLVIFKRLRLLKMNNRCS
jgi:cation transport ATPase